MIDQLLDRYTESERRPFVLIVKVLGVLLFNVGFISLLWSLPDGIIDQWMGPREFSNWATVYAVVVTVYYGSESFSLTFGGGAFMLGALFGTRELINLNLFTLENQIIYFLLAGFVLLFVSRILSGNLKTVYKDVVFIPLMPAWVLRFVYKWFGMNF